MPISAPGSSKRRARGFTLVEMLALLVVIGVVVATLQLNLFKDDARRLRDEAERLAALITALRDEAVTGGQPLALVLDEDRYRFARRETGTGWRELAGDDVFGPRALAHGVRVVELRVDGEPMPPGARLMFSPSGVDAPFSALFRLGDAFARVDADAVGRVTVADAGLDRLAPARP